MAFYSNLFRTCIWSTFVYFLPGIMSEDLREWHHDPHKPGGPQDWKQTFAECGRKFQSPIDFSFTEARHIERKDELGPINFTLAEPFGATPYVNLRNELKIEVPERNIELKGGCLPPKKFNAYEMRFHWGSVSTRGSEHKIGGISYPLEVQLLAASPEKSENVKIAVSFLFTVSKLDNPYMDQLMDATRLVVKPDSRTTVNLRGLLNKMIGDVGTYYCYVGSDSSPPCESGFLWVVFTRLHLISEKQLDVFRDVLAQEQSDTPGVPIRMWNNFRSPQPLGQRTVYLVSSAGRPAFVASSVQGTISRFGFVLVLSMYGAAVCG